MSSPFDLSALKKGIVWNKSSQLCMTCFGQGIIPDPEDNSENWNCGVIECPDCFGEGLVYENDLNEKNLCARELWKTVWRAARMYQKKNYPPATDVFDLMTDSMVFAYMLDFTPYQLFELIQASRQLLRDRDAVPQLNMMQYKLACRNGEISFDEELTF